MARSKPLKLKGSDDKWKVQLAIPLFLLPGIYAIAQGRWMFGSFFLAIGFILAVSFLKPVHRSLPGQLFSQLSPFLKYGLIWFLWAALAVTTFKFPSFSWAHALPVWVPFSPLYWIQMVCFAGLVGAFLLLNSKAIKEKDLTSLTARVWFWAILLFGVFMRVYAMNQAQGSYGFDEAGGIMETRLVRDLQDYRDGYYIAYYQKPIFCYITLFLWHWLPNATDLLIIRLAATLVDLGNIWLLYLTGKEIGGRRTGLLAAAMGAACKPLLNLSAMGMGGPMVILSFLLPVLMVIRLFKKPNLRHFIQTGLALALGVYTNDYIRIALIIFTFYILVWILSKKENRNLQGLMGLVIVFNILVLGFYYFYMSFGFAKSSWIYQLFDRWRTESFLAMLGCFLVLIIFGCVAKFKWKSAKKSEIWIYALASLWICTLLDYPTMTRADFLERIDNLVNRGGGALSESLASVLGKIGTANELLFWDGTWPANMGLVGDAFFGFGETVLIFLGLAYFLTKPNWISVFVFIAAVAGILPHAFAGGTHNLRVAGAVGPLLLLAAVGLNELLKYASQMPRGRFVFGATLLLLMGFWAWSAQTAYSRVYYQWFDHQTLFFTSARSIAFRETAAGSRVYFCDDIFSDESVVLNEGVVIHKIYPTNIIYKNPGDKPQDVSVVVHDFSGGPGKDIREKIRKFFPEAVWTLENEVSLCRIPYDLIAKKRQNLFVFKDELKPAWKREYIRNECGLIFDLIAYEDRAPHVFDPIGPDYAATYLGGVNQLVEAVRFSTTIHVEKEGDYIVHYQAVNRSRLKIDGQTVSDLYFFKLLNYMAPEKQGDETIQLSSGEHQIEVVVAFQRNDRFPEFLLRPKGSDGAGVSLWSSFNF